MGEEYHHPADGGGATSPQVRTVGTPIPCQEGNTPLTVPGQDGGCHQPADGGGYPIPDQNGGTPLGINPHQQVGVRPPPVQVRSQVRIGAPPTGTA